MKRILLSVLVVGILLLSACGAPTPVSEPEIPAHYATYTDEAKLFSISYPPEWETALSLIADLEKTMKGVISSLESSLPVEKASVMFVAGLRTATGYTPSVNIVVEPMPTGTSTHDQVVEAEIRGIRKIIQDYREFSRVKTTVGGREATIVEWEGTFPGQDKMHYLQMITLVGKTVWVVSCTTSSGDFAKWENDLHAVVRSLRILK